MKPIEFIRSRSPFDQLDEEGLVLVEQSLEVMRFEPGDYILVKGGPPSDYLYIIGEGVVRLLHKSEEINTMERGEVFGYPSMLRRTSPTLDVVSGSEVVLYGVPKATFQKLVNHFAEFFLKDLSQRLYQTWELDAPPALGSDFARPVKMLVNRFPVFVSPEATVGTAARLMRQTNITSVLVEGEPPGIVTLQDLNCRVLAEDLGSDTLVRQIMTHPLKTLPCDTPIYSALFYMMEERVSHLPLTEDGQVKGLITRGNLLRYQVKSPFYLLRQLESLDSSAVVVKYNLDVTGRVESLFNDGLEVDLIGRIVSSLNDALVKRLLHLAEADLGPPPTPYAWLVFGSEGRMEQTLLTDQDNALVYFEDSPEARTYFERLAEKIISKLIEVGFPPCPGGYMATNWCHPLAEWEEMFNNWLTQPDPQALMEAGIFFDFRLVHGDLIPDSLDNILIQANDYPVFMAQMANAAIEFRPPLGFFGGIRADEGQVDLKKRGIAPIVALGRLYGLEAQSTARTTIERLEAAAADGLLSQEGVNALIDAFRYLLGLRLREQLQKIEADQQPDNDIQLDHLSSREKRRLKEAFKVIRDMQEATAQRFNTNFVA